VNYSRKDDVQIRGPSSLTVQGYEEENRLDKSRFEEVAKVGAPTSIDVDIEK